jgi:hypothetical protein
VTSQGSQPTDKDTEDLLAGSKLQDVSINIQEEKKTKGMFATLSKFEIFLDKNGKEVESGWQSDLDTRDEQRH